MATLAPKFSQQTPQKVLDGMVVETLKIRRKVKKKKKKQCQPLRLAMETVIDTSKVSDGLMAITKDPSEIAWILVVS